MTSRHPHDNLVPEVDNSEDAEVKVMNKTRTAAGLLVGVLLGIAWGLGFKSIPIGCVSAAGFSALFIYIFNTVKRSSDK